jgi:hypothetical protein
MRDKKAYVFHLLIITFIFLLSGCGYKGDPKYTATSSNGLVGSFQTIEQKQNSLNSLISKKSVKRENS